MEGMFWDLRVLGFGFQYWEKTGSVFEVIREFSFLDPKNLSYGRRGLLLYVEPVVDGDDGRPHGIRPPGLVSPNYLETNKTGRKGNKKEKGPDSRGRP